ncbi:MAG: MarR family winged helix-turn-helix transcriptional regulator [Labedaea sp.]
MTETRLDFGILLILACAEFVNDLRQALAEQGFDDQGRSDGYLLRTVGANPLTVSELAERLEISKQGAGQIVDDMERRGYVERRPDPADRRARLLYLTARGQDALASARRFHQQYERRMIKTHGREAVAAMRTLLGAMAGPGQMADPRFRPMYL